MGGARGDGHGAGEVWVGHWGGFSGLYRCEVELGSRVPVLVGFEGRRCWLGHDGLEVRRWGRGAITTVAPIRTRATTPHLL